MLKLVYSTAQPSPLLKQVRPAAAGERGYSKETRTYKSQVYIISLI